MRKDTRKNPADAVAMDPSQLAWTLSPRAIVGLIRMDRGEAFEPEVEAELTGLGLIGPPVQAAGKPWSRTNARRRLTPLGRDVFEVLRPSRVMDDVSRHVIAMLASWKANHNLHVPLRPMVLRLEEQLSDRYPGYSVELRLAQTDLDEKLEEVPSYNFVFHYVKQSHGYMYSGQVAAIIWLKQISPASPQRLKQAETKPERSPAVRDEPRLSRSSPFVRMDEKDLEREIHRSQMHNFSVPSGPAWISTLRFDERKARRGE